MAKSKGKDKDLLDDELDEELEDLDLDDEDDDLLDDEEGDEEDDEEEEEDEDEILAAAEAEEPGEVDPFFEEAAGYAQDFDWNSLSDEDRETHENILNATLHELEQLNLKRTPLFDRWAAAQAFARHGERETFQEICRSLIKSRRRHDALQYEDIYLELISDLAEVGEHDEAFDYLEKFQKAFPEEEHIYERVYGLLLVEAGKIHEGKEKLDELMVNSDERGYLHLEIGDDLVAMGHAEIALRILARGKDFARRHSDTELMTAIDETRRLALAKIDGEEV